MGEHTKGPWTVERYGDGDSLVIHHSDDDRVCFMATPGRRGDMSKIRANARLIAAAPELLAALLSVEWAALVDDVHGGMEDGCPCCDQAQRFGHDQECELADAIAKATGSRATQPPEHP